MWAVSFAMMSLLLAACGNTAPNEGASTEGDKQPNVEPTKEPLELSVYYMGSDSSTERFMEVYGDAIRKKYPNFTLKWMNYNSVKFADLAPTKTPVDIFYGPMGNYPLVTESGYADMDITDLVQTNKIDLNKLEPASLGIMKQMNGGKLNALPINLLYLVLVYNKDIFDKFGEPYPKDGMTWDQTLEIAKRLTRQDAGVQYMGFGNQQWAAFWRGNQYGQEMFDAAAGKAILDSGKWPDMFRKIVPFFQIDGNPYMPDPANTFTKERRLAMMVGLNSQVTSPTVFQGVNYDVVQLPTYPDRPGVGSGPQPLWFSVSGTTAHRKEAFAAIAQLLTPEYQMQIARTSSYPALQMDGLEQILGSDNEQMKTRNIKGLIPNKFAPAPLPTLYGIAPASALNEAFNAAATGQKDINTALREANEKLNKLLEERKAAGAK